MPGPGARGRPFPIASRRTLSSTARAGIRPIRSPSTPPIRRSEASPPARPPRSCTGTRLPCLGQAGASAMSHGSRSSNPATDPPSPRGLATARTPRPHARPRDRNARRAVFGKAGGWDRALESTRAGRRRFRSWLSWPSRREMGTHLLASSSTSLRSDIGIDQVRRRRAMRYGVGLTARPVAARPDSMQCSQGADRRTPYPSEGRSSLWSHP
jgi:hypothetical protein